MVCLEDNFKTFLKMSTQYEIVNRNDYFPGLKNAVYLDHTGATLVSRGQLTGQFKDLTSSLYGNPHSRSPSSQLTTDTIDSIRYRVLKFFSASPDEYSIIFTSGCTAALKLVAENFDYHGNCCHSKQDPDDPASKGDVCHCVQHQHGEHCKGKLGSFSYLLDNHTSAQGMREYALEKAGKVQCVDCIKDGELEILSVIKDERRPSCHCGNHLFCFPAQSNFSGRKYPLDWVSMVTNRKMSWQTSNCDIISSKNDSNVRISSQNNEDKVCQLPGNEKEANIDQTFNANNETNSKQFSVKECNSSQPFVDDDTTCQPSSVSRSHCGCHGSWFTILDAASLVSTSPLNLSTVKLDFVTLSFYKIFGLPTGLGALIVRNDSSHVLRKRYYGGGTVSVSLPSQRFHVLRSNISDRFEDGTVSYLDIISLRHGFDALQTFFPGGMQTVSLLTFNLAQYFHHQLTSCCHGNGAQLAEVYCDGNFQDSTKHGAIVTFNLLRPNGMYIGFSEVDKMAQLYDIHVRTGCFCNIGACQKYLHMTDGQIRRNFQAGHVCGDDRDLVDGRPTGAVRISFGYMSTLADAQKCLQFIVVCFLENTVKPVFWSQENVVDDNITNVIGAGKSICSSKISAVNPNDVVIESDSINVIEFTGALNDCKHKVTASSNDVTPSNIESRTLHETSYHNKEKSQIKDDGENKRMLDNKSDSNLYNEIKHFTKISDNVESSNVAGNTVQDMVDVLEETMETGVICKGRKLSSIFLYPVKSCAAFKVRRWPVSSRGLLYDREWMVVTETGIAMSQKREPRLCLLRPSIDLETSTLTLEFPGMESITLSLEDMDGTVSDQSLCNSKVCGDRVSSVDCGQAVSDWLSEALYRNGCRLIRQTSDDKRTSKLKKSKNAEGSPAGPLSLANESQYLLISRDSVVSLRDQLLTRRDEGDTQECFDVDNLVDRFRANLVVSGFLPFEEEQWKSVQIGSVIFQSQGVCTRCQMVCMDQQTGERSKEPLKTLAHWRGSKVPFGIHLFGNLGTTGRQEIEAGDPVHIL